MAEPEWHLLFGAAIATDAASDSPGVFVAGILPTTAANFVSTLGCAWLLNRIQSLPAASRRRLFPRQLRWLAISDIIFHLASCFDNVVGFASIGYGTSTGNNLCMWSSHLLRFGTNMSMCVEMHIAVTFAAQCMRLRCLLGALPNMLRGIPVVALVFMLIEAFTAPAHQDASGWCTPKDDDNDYISVYLMVTSFSVSSIAYLLTSIQACNAGEVVAARAWKRAMAYPLSFILTQFVVVIIIFSPTNYDKTSPMLVLGVTLQNLNGFANTMVYALQSRYATRFLSEKPVRTCPVTGEDDEHRQRALMEHSFPVRMGGVTIEEIIPASYASTLASAQSGGTYKEARSHGGTNLGSETVATFFEDAVARTQSVDSRDRNGLTVRLDLGGSRNNSPVTADQSPPAAEMPWRGLSPEAMEPPRVGRGAPRPK